MISTPKTKIVPLGQIVATPRALEVIEDSGQFPLEFIKLHQNGNWGEISAEDWELNDKALECGDRLLSCYTIKSGNRIWIITEADRSVTTILLPEEY
ncbi:hypothetical protein P3T73_03350 [Kiritimatiellota bacterium B12222]|nr:hypothetical protein P3T73_03350 [Kiritimatiellota bacterium B12222]